MKTLKLIRYGEEHPMCFCTAKYIENDNLYVGLVTYIEGYPEPWSDLTVNLIRCKENCAFIDTNNNGDDIVDWLISNNLGKLTGRTCRSGWCIYPEFEFNLDILKEFIDAEYC